MRSFIGKASFGKGGLNDVAFSRDIAATYSNDDPMKARREIKGTEERSWIESQNESGSKVRMDME